MVQSFATFGWAIAHRETETHSFLIRFRQLPNEFPFSDYPIRLTIYWNIAETNSLNRFPSGAESMRINQFEDSLVEAVEPDKLALLLLVEARGHQRKFIFQTHDAHECLARLSNLTQEEVPYPIEVSTDEDPAWVYYFTETSNTK